MSTEERMQRDEMEKLKIIRKYYVLIAPTDLTEFENKEYESEKSVEDLLRDSFQNEDQEG